MTATRRPYRTRPCRCHSDDSLYGTLTECPKCGHRSLDTGEGWQACERRRCGYEGTLNKALGAYGEVWE